MTTDIEALVAKAIAVEERLYNRLGTKSARALDVDACVIIGKLYDALQSTQAVVVAARERKRARQELDEAAGVAVQRSRGVLDDEEALDALTTVYFAALDAEDTALAALGKPEHG